MRAGSLLLALMAMTACTPTGDAGCVAYAMQRPSMPDLPDDALGAWVAVTDTALTGACR